MVEARLRTREIPGARRKEIVILPGTVIIIRRSRDSERHAGASWMVVPGFMEDRLTALSASTLLTHAPDVPSRPVEGKGVLINLDSGHYFSLNETGQFIWARLNGEQDLGAIAAEVAAEYEVNPEEALDDTLALAIELLREGLVDVIRAE